VHLVVQLEGGLQSETGPRQKQEIIPKKIRAGEQTRAGDVAQETEHLARKCEAQSSNSSTAKKWKEGRDRERQRERKREKEISLE
jgi:hypothetical protein